MSSGDTTGVQRHLGAGYHGWFAPTSCEAVPYDRDGAVEGMDASVGRLIGAELHVRHRMVSRRGEDEVGVFYEREIRQGGAVHSSAVILECWRLTEGRWWLEREITEHGASVG